VFKRHAAEKFLPYQSLIASIMQKYVSRSASQANEPVRFVMQVPLRVESPLAMHNTRSNPIET
jgi:hypothetical protein